MSMVTYATLRQFGLLHTQVESSVFHCLLYVVQVIIIGFWQLTTLIEQFSFPAIFVTL